MSKTIRLPYFPVWAPALKWPPGLEGAPGQKRTLWSFAFWIMTLVWAPGVKQAPGHVNYWNYEHWGAHSGKYGKKYGKKISAKKQGITFSPSLFYKAVFFRTNKLYFLQNKLTTALIWQDILPRHKYPSAASLYSVLQSKSVCVLTNLFTNLVSHL